MYTKNKSELKKINETNRNKMITMVTIFFSNLFTIAFGHYKLIQLTHYHPKGRYFGIDAFKIHDSYFIPLVNTVLCLDLRLVGKRKDL